MSSSPLADIIGGILNHNQQQKLQNANSNILNFQMQPYQNTYETLFGGGANGAPGMFGQLRDPTLTNLNAQLQALYGDGTDQNPGLFSTLNSQNATTYNPANLLSAFMNGQYDPYGQNTPGLQGALSNFNDLLPQLQGNSALASQIFANGGATPQSQASFDNLTGLMQGQSGNQQNLTGTANNIFNSNGTIFNPLNNNFQQAAAGGLFEGLNGSNPMLNFANLQAQNIAGQQGQTGPTNQGIGTALGLTANNGMTPALGQLSNSGGNVLAGQGGTPTNQALEGIGINLARQPSLVSPQQAIGIARDQAGTQYQRNAEAALQQAQARGGGAGSTVANGLQNQGLADYSDRGSQAEAQAVENALLNQQGLQLNQANMGGNMAQAGQGLQNSLFGLGGNFIQGANAGALGNVSEGLSGLGNLAGLQSQRQLSSLGLVPNIAQTGFNEANTFGNLGLGSQAQNLQELGLGGQFAQDVTGSQLGANNAFNNLIGTQNQYGLGAGTLANQGSNDMASILQSIMGGNLTAANQGLNRTNTLFNNLQQGIGNNQNLMNWSGNQLNNSTNNYRDLFNSMLGFQQGNANAVNQSLIRGMGLIPSQNPWGTTIQNGANSLLDIIQQLAQAGG